MSYIVHSTFQHICSGTILCTLHHTAGPPVFWRLKYQIKFRPKLQNQTIAIWDCLTPWRDIS